MAAIYAALIKKGLKTLEDVPDKLKEAVQKIWTVIQIDFQSYHKNTFQKGD